MTYEVDSPSENNVGQAEPEDELLAKEPVPAEPKPPEPDAQDSLALSEDSPSVLQAEEAQAAKVKAAPEPQKKSSHVIRVIVSLLVISLLAFGYLKRESLLKVFSRAESQSGAASGKERKIIYWVDPMHPAYKSDKPGTAPDCGMDLVPVYEDGGQMGTSLPLGTVQISPERQQLIGVQYGQASYQTVFKTVRTVARLAYDETKITHVHTKYEGWIEDVYVDFTGKLVEKGQPLLSIYSPELLQSQQEFLLARRGRAELGESAFREAAYGAQSLYEAARKRLELWDLSEGQIKELERSGKPAKALPIYAPNGGFVLTRNAYPKQRVTPETDLYTIADLSNIWVIADIYEFEAAEIRLGQTATVTLNYFPGRTFQGKVTYIYPQLDNATRTLKVRIEVPNPDFTLKPDMYANVEVKIDYGRHIVVPQEAVMDSGSEQLVFIAHEGGYFEPRKVSIGAKVEQSVIVLSGLKAGERVVTSANFLIDSESKLKSATGGMGMPGMDHGAENKAGQPPTDHTQHKAAPPTPAADHSQHQSQGAAQTKIEDHSAHAKVAAEHDHAKQTGKVLYYYCPMHEDQRSDQPGTCPKCKMSLIPKHADKK